MAIIIMASLGGSPGVTTTSLGMSILWPRDVILADCDPHPNQTILAGYLRGTPAHGIGMSAMINAYRERRFSQAIVSANTVALAESEGHSARFLPGFTHPNAAGHCAPYWSAIAEQFAEHSGDVIVDCGRLGPDGIPEALASSARLVVLMVHSDLPSLASFRLSMPHLLSTITVPCGLVVIGPGRPYSASEVTSALKVTLIGQIGWYPQLAGGLTQGENVARTRGAARLWRSYSAVVSALSAHMVAGGRRD